MKDEISTILKESADIKTQVARSMSKDIEAIAGKILESIKSGGKLVLFGNGGSAADCQHIQGELTHQFEIKHRKAIPCIALTTNTSVLTAIGNDWGFDQIFERQVEKVVDEKDVVIGLSTSGNSENVIKGIEQARKQGAFTIVFSGKDGGKLKQIADSSFIVPSDNTARIQEVHITVGHILCRIIEKELCNE